MKFLTDQPKCRPCMGTEWEDWCGYNSWDWNVWENTSHKETDCALRIGFDIQITIKHVYNVTCLGEAGNGATQFVICLLDACKVFNTNQAGYVKKKKKNNKVYYLHEKSCNSMFIYTAKQKCQIWTSFVSMWTRQKTFFIHVLTMTTEDLVPKEVS